MSIRETLEANVETTLQAMTIAAGYPLPKNLGLVTRQILDYDETAGKRPAAIIQGVSLRTELYAIGGIALSTLLGRVVFYFDVETNGQLPATYANAYLAAARVALLQDQSRGGVSGVLTTTVTFEPTASLWKQGQALEATLDFEIAYMHEGDA